MYAKLIDGQLMPMHQPLKIAGLDTFTNDPAVMLSQGFKPVVFTDPPAQEGYHATSEWAETEDAITQVWELQEIPEPSETPKETEPPIEP